MNFLKGKKTIIFGVLTMIAAAFQASNGVLSKDQAAEALVIVGAINIALRFVTDTPVGVGGTKFVIGDTPLGDQPPAA